MAVKSKQRKWTKATIERRRRERERMERVFPYLQLPCFADPFTDVAVVLGGGPNEKRRPELSIGVPSEDRIRECCEAIRRHFPREPVGIGAVAAEIFLVSPAPPGKANSPWTP